jgi:uncharacterized membrane protein YidH (DUF202 family)
MENKEWNKNDWQGREKKQIDTTNVIVYLTMGLVAATIFLAGLYYGLTFIANHLR